MWKIKAPAKINLFLEVGERKNGLHPICSLIDIISLYDIIYIKISKKSSLKFISKWKIPEENTVSKLLSILKEKFDFNLDIKIKKNIPPGSGLGGASSDAGVLLICLNKILKLGLNIQEMIEISKNIGSDVPFFIFGKRCIVEEFGEKIFPVDDFTFYYLLLIPDFSLKTAEVYNKLDEIGEFGNLTISKERIRILIEKIKTMDIKEIEENMFNRLEKAAFEIRNEIKEVKNEVEEKTGKRFFLTGSGGVLFSIYKEKEEVEKIMKKINIDGWRKKMVKSIKFVL